MPAIVRSNVVLPQPEGPSSAKNSPVSTRSDTSSTAVTDPNRLVTRPSSSIEPRRAEPADGVRGSSLDRRDLPLEARVPGVAPLGDLAVIERDELGEVLPG